MRKIFCFVTILILTLFTSSTYAQSPLTDTNDKKKPFLIDDVHTESLLKAKEALLAPKLVASSVIKNLTDKQMRDISKIEKCRNKRLSKIEKKITLAQSKLMNYQTETVRNSSKIDKTIDSISELVINYKKEIAKASAKIRSKLNANQQLVFDKQTSNRFDY
jgi:CRISPR/Cas system CSM-associated protein Csm4 (group 5 of RAMP superfamily)